MIASQLILASVALAYNLCDTANYRYAGKKVHATIVPSAAKSIVVNGKQTLVSVVGEITIVDGCHFSVSGLKITGPKTFNWYGAYSETDQAAVKLTEGPFDALTTTNGVFTFIQTAGNWVSYDDFSQFNLFDPVSNTVIGIAKIVGGSPPASTGAAVGKTVTTIGAAVQGGSVSNTATAGTAAVASFLTMSVLISLLL